MPHCRVTGVTCYSEVFRTVDQAENIKRDIYHCNQLNLKQRQECSRKIYTDGLIFSIPCRTIIILQKMTFHYIKHYFPR